MTETTSACYPGSFNPCTVAHLAVADAARQQLGVDVVTFVLSESALGKDNVGPSHVGERAAAISSLAAQTGRVWLRAQVVPERFLADIVVALDADWLIVGGDKWEQLIDPSWYGGPQGRASTLAPLSRVAVAPRAGSTPPTTAVVDELAESLGKRWTVVTLAIAEQFATVSSTAVREGRSEWSAGTSAAG